MCRRRPSDFDRMRTDMEDGMRRMSDDMEAGFQRMHARMESRMEARRRYWEDRRRSREEHRSARRSQYGACSANGPWAYWWLIFPLVFWVLPAMGRQGWGHGGWSNNGNWIGDVAGDLSRAWLNAGPLGWAIDRFSALTGFSQGDAAGVLLAAVAVNAAVIVFALTRAPR